MRKCSRKKSKRKSFYTVGGSERGIVSRVTVRGGICKRRDCKSRIGKRRNC
jgi:hypothetical protein